MSDKDKNIDDLRALLRKRLADTDAAEDGWNVPSQEVWTGLSDELAAHKNQGQRSTYWLGAVIMALLALLLFRECAYRGKIGNMNTQIQQLKDSYEKLVQNCAEKTSSNQTEKTQEATATLGVAQSAPVLGRQAIPARNFAEKSAYQLPDFGSPVIENELHTATDNFSETLNGSILPVTKGVTIPPFAALLLAIPSTFFEKENELPKYTLPLSKEEKNTKKLSFIVLASTGLAFTGNRLKGEIPSIIADQKALIGWNAALGLGAMFNRHWSLETGLRYGIHRIQTDYALTVPFTHNGETIQSDGNFDNQYNHSLPSSFGNYPLQMVLTRESSANVAEGEDMRLDLSIQQRIQQLSLPLHLRYGFGKHRWQAGIRTGFVANHTLAVRAEGSPDLISHHGAIHQRHTNVGNPSIGDLQKFTFDASLGLDLRYQVSPRFGLSLHGNWQRAITPVYDGENVQNYLQALGLGAGLQFLLR